jgi:hypothetical protein
MQKNQSTVLKMKEINEIRQFQESRGATLAGT